MQAKVIIEDNELKEIIRTHLQDKLKFQPHIVSVDFKLPSIQDQDSNDDKQVTAEITIDLSKPNHSGRPGGG